jgi:hypothetical protein
MIKSTMWPTTAEIFHWPKFLHIYPAERADVDLFIYTQCNRIHVRRIRSDSFLFLFF